MEEPKVSETTSINRFFKQLLNGLKVYSRDYSKNDWTCHLCCKILGIKEINELFAGYNFYLSKIQQLSNRFIAVIERRESEKKEDIFTELETFEDEINKNKKGYKKIKYYKFVNNNKERYLENDYYNDL